MNHNCLQASRIKIAGTISRRCGKNGIILFDCYLARPCDCWIEIIQEKHDVIKKRHVLQLFPIHKNISDCLTNSSVIQHGLYQLILSCFFAFSHCPSRPWSTTFFLSFFFSPFFVLLFPSFNFFATLTVPVVVVPVENLIHYGAKIQRAKYLPRP